MTTGTPSQGSQATLFMKSGSSPYTWDGSSERYEFLHENLKLVESFIYTNGISGTRSERVEQTRRKTRMVRGVIVMNVSPTYLVNILPRALGGTPSGGLAAQTFSLAETVPSFGVLINRVAGVFECKDCYINRWMLSGQQIPPDDDSPNFLTMALEIFGFEETAPASAPSLPSISLPTTADYQYYVYDDMVATLVAATRELKNFKLMVNNHLQARWVASATPTAWSARHRSVVLEASNPFTTADIAALYNQTYTGSAGNLAFTNTNLATTFTFGALQVPRESPTVPGKTELDLPLTMFARMTGTTRELSVLNDSVP